MQSSTRSIKSKPEENEDPAKIIKGKVPLTQTRSDIGGDDDSKEDDSEEKKSKCSKRNRWIYGIGSFLLLCSLAGVIVSTDLKERKSSTNNLVIQPTVSPTVSNMPTSSPSDAPSLTPSATPTTSPSESPSSTPTATPSLTPSATPTTSPSESPSSTPTATPSQAPFNIPTMFPTELPTPEVFPQNPEPNTPTATPSQAPSATPTTSPSGSPTSTATPSQAPSNTPTMFSTELPTPEVFPQNPEPNTPTMFPKELPTPGVFPQNPEPRNPPSSYFNYDPDSNYGPHRWNNVNTRNSWLKEFGNDGYGPWNGFLAKDDDVTGNKCGGPKRMQSPKNLSNTRGDGSECEAGHEIRTTCATHPLSDASTTRIRKWYDPFSRWEKTE